MAVINVMDSPQAVRDFLTLQLADREVSEEHEVDGSYTLTYQSMINWENDVPRFTLSTQTDHLRLAELQDVIEMNIRKEGTIEKEFVMSNKISMR